jgi:microcompartment protein CcmK/EutM
MILCKVLGPVVSTEKHPAFARLKLLLVKPVDGGKTFIAADRIVSAGEGDTVLVLREGTGIRQLFGMPATAKLPIRSLIVGVVDQLSEG